MSVVKGASAAFSGRRAASFPAQTSHDESFVVPVTERNLLVGQCVHTS